MRDKRNYFCDCFIVPADLHMMVSEPEKVRIIFVNICSKSLSLSLFEVG